MREAKRPLLSVVVPAYNEERRIGATLERLVGYLAQEIGDAEIVVVDDGSRDGTAAIVRHSANGPTPVRLLSLARNRGKGYAVRAGMLHARGTYILMSDADLSTPIEELRALLGPVERGQYDIAIGSRGLPASRFGKRQPWARERMGRIANLLVRAVTGTPIRDTQCGFKLFRRDAACDLFARQRSTGFGFDFEIVYLAERAGYRILEQPVTWNNALGSKVRPVRDALASFFDLLCVRVRDLRGSYRTEAPAPEVAEAR